MHEKHITEGIILSKRPVGEANLLVSVLTQDMGLITAKAISARREASKLRYGLEPMTLARFSFIKGKAEWRVTGADDVSREYLAASPSQRRRLGQVSRLITRLVLGAEPSAELYRTVKQGFDSLAHTEAHADSVECVLVLRILAHLGYLPELPALSRFVDTDAFTPELAAEAAASRKLLIKLINDSLQATGL